jgi:dihydrofolate reductase
MIKLIAAIDINGLLGFNNTIPWHYPEDFRRFKTITMGGILIMGKNTVRSLPNKLPGRKIIAISDSDEPKADLIAHSFYEAVEKALLIDKANVWIAGGASVYNQALDMDYVTTCDITIVPEKKFDSNLAEGVVYFPTYKLNLKYELVSSEANRNDPRLLHNMYARKK